VTVVARGNVETTEAAISERCQDHDPHGCFLVSRAYLPGLKTTARGRGP
jgi:hypothetical protein